MACIMIVDDNRELAEMLALAAGMTGHQALVAFDGEHALKLMDERLPDLLLLDLNMPGMDGFEVLRRMRMRSFAKPIQVVVLSAVEDKNLGERAIQAGALRCIYKPVSLAVLNELTSEYLGSSPSPDGLGVRMSENWQSTSRGAVSGALNHGPGVEPDLEPEHQG